MRLISFWWGQIPLIKYCYYFTFYMCIINETFSNVGETAPPHTAQEVHSIRTLLEYRRETREGRLMEHLLQEVGSIARGICVFGIDNAQDYTYMMWMWPVVRCSMCQGSLPARGSGVHRTQKHLYRPDLKRARAGWWGNHQLCSLKRLNHKVLNWARRSQKKRGSAGTKEISHVAGCQGSGGVNDVEQVNAWSGPAIAHHHSTISSLITW